MDSGTISSIAIQRESRLRDFDGETNPDGFELASRLTANGARVNVVLVSSRDYSDLTHLIERSGARGFVPKAELSGPRLAALVT